MAQLDVKNAYLKGIFECEVWMEPLEGLQVANRKTKCRLTKAICGLPESAYCWNKRLNAELLMLNLKRSSADRCIALFIDDAICMASSKRAIEFVLEQLSNVFELTIVNPSVFVALQNVRERKSWSIIIHQAGYTRKIIERFGLANANPNTVPADPHTILNFEMIKDSENNDMILYRELIGSLITCSEWDSQLGPSREIPPFRWSEEFFSVLLLSVDATTFEETALATARRSDIRHECAAGDCVDIVVKVTTRFSTLHRLLRRASGIVTALQQRLRIGSKTLERSYEIVFAMLHLFGDHKGEGSHDAVAFTLFEGSIGLGL
ncbi:hypothetical protein KM043_014451 [Ampulex compressa]|nr:hypothetical protein KM043_014451 [Ampulex compressa]